MNEGEVTCSLRVNIGQEVQATATYVYFSLFFGTALTQEDQSFHVISRNDCACNPVVVINYLVELQLLEIKPLTASRGIRSPYLPIYIFTPGKQQYA
jgi:hypothetical protein